MMSRYVRSNLFRSGTVALTLSCCVTLAAQQAEQSQTSGAGSTANAAVPPTVTPSTGAPNAAALPSVATPAGYVIGSDDVLTIMFWRDKDMSGDFAVRPDGKISVPLLNDVQAAGLTPEELRAGLIKAATAFMADPSITVVVKAINSRNVYITGSVAKPGTYPLTESMTVLQLIAKAGGLLEYADAKNIIVVHAERRPDGEPWSDKVNYKDMLDRKNLKQNIALKPGDTIIVK